MAGGWEGSGLGLGGMCPTHIPAPAFAIMGLHANASLTPRCQPAPASHQDACHAMQASKTSADYSPREDSGTTDDEEAPSGKIVKVEKVKVSTAHGQCVAVCGGDEMGLTSQGWRQAVRLD